MPEDGKGIEMLRSLRRREVVGAGTATLAMPGLSSMRTAAKKRKKRKKPQGTKVGCDGCFRNLSIGEEVIFAVEDGVKDEGISLCPEGTRAISGTLLLGNENCVVTEFGAFDTDLTGWKLAISCPLGEESEVNAVVALCIS
jgi:hypothetical protein